MAAFWLACKLEEVIEIDNPHRLTLRSVVTVVDRVTRRREARALTVMDPYSQVGAARDAVGAARAAARLLPVPWRAPPTSRSPLLPLPPPAPPRRNMRR